jgi:hypothetical protein
MLCGMQTSQRRTFLLLTLVTLPTPINNLIFPFFFLSLSIFLLCVAYCLAPSLLCGRLITVETARGREKKAELYNNSIDKTLYPSHHRKQQLNIQNRGGLYLILFG